MDNGNRRLATVPMIIDCGHCPAVRLEWMPNGQEIPDLFFVGMPPMGRMILSKQSVFIACHTCAKDLNAIISEAGRTVNLQQSGCV